MSGGKHYIFYPTVCMKFTRVNFMHTRPKDLPNLASNPFTPFLCIIFTHPRHWRSGKKYHCSAASIVVSCLLFSIFIRSTTDFEAFSYFIIFSCFFILLSLAYRLLYRPFSGGRNFTAFLLKPLKSCGRLLRKFLP